MLVIVRSLDKDANLGELSKTLTKAAKGTDYFFIITKERFDFEVMTRDEATKLREMIDKYLERYPE